jgi:hypothetical protein
MNVEQDPVGIVQRETQMTLRKRIGHTDPEPPESGWLDLERIAHVEVSSEDPDRPIDDALLGGAAAGWRASHPGEQRVRIRFDAPQNLTHVHLVFDEAGRERVQEFELRWSNDGGRAFRSLVRQQFSFSPGGATREVEDYSVSLAEVTDLELHLIPDISHQPVVATLTAWRLR